MGFGIEESKMITSGKYVLLVNTKGYHKRWRNELLVITSKDGIVLCNIDDEYECFHEDDLFLLED
jgi:hypothetical protein